MQEYISDFSEQFPGKGQVRKREPAKAERNKLHQKDVHALKAVTDPWANHRRVIDT